MTGTLVDTSVLVDVLRGFEPAVRVLEDLRRSAVLHSSVVVRAEILAGMRPHEEESTRELLDAFEWHSVTEATAEEAGRLGHRWMPGHHSIDTADLLIAATARILDRTVLTRNLRHFPMFPDLSSPY